MNKRINTLLFVLGATLFNIIITVLSFLILFISYVKLIMPLMPAEANPSWAFAFIFLAAIAASFAVYRFLLKYLLKKIDTEKYFDPLFVKKYKK